MGSNAPKALRKRYAYFIRTMVNKKVSVLISFYSRIVLPQKERESGF